MNKHDSTGSVPIQINRLTTPWFVDRDCCRVYTGHAHGRRCVAAIGPRDISRLKLVVTSNPKGLWYALRKSEGADLVVHEAAWSVGSTAHRVLAEAVTLIDKAGMTITDGWVQVTRDYLRPLLHMAAEKAGVPVLMHCEFVGMVVQQKTDELRAGLMRYGVSPAEAAKHRYTAAMLPRGPRPNLSLAPPRFKRGIIDLRRIGMMYKAGRTQKEIGQELGISKQRVAAILKNQLGLTRADGGVSVRRSLLT